eukprot:gnl/TRDRNA2_/TRDRNA2_183912_c0_seq1.p1 gnl/TRDRNA2_/TRDRNA2_183912_c0~~gnl/TRDRNA2_/TRDRNA2_183912_c0_seq1.p1  ORF type:complete len:244 (-),score=59.76 gnl/TRDRNA2_/TRDRNA2_183912_c0_seq1:362-1093(-)
MPPEDEPASNAVVVPVVAAMHFVADALTSRSRSRSPVAAIDLVADALTSRSRSRSPRCSVRCRSSTEMSGSVEGRAVDIMLGSTSWKLVQQQLVEWAQWGNLMVDLKPGCQNSTVSETEDDNPSEVDECYSEVDGSLSELEDLDVSDAQLEQEEDGEDDDDDDDDDYEEEHTSTLKSEHEELDAVLSDVQAEDEKDRLGAEASTELQGCPTHCNASATPEEESMMLCGPGGRAMQQQQQRDSD